MAARLVASAFVPGEIETILVRGFDEREMSQPQPDACNPDVAARVVDQPVQFESIVHCSLETERDFLQSLLQFRAFKASGMIDRSWEKWNEESQKVLSGAILFGCAGIPVEVYEAMTSAGVLPDAETFALLVRGCLVVNDLPNARVFVASMSNAGFLPPKELVAAVMTGFQSIANHHTGLNKHAPVFVPKFGSLNPML